MFSPSQSYPCVVWAPQIAVDTHTQQVADRPYALLQSCFDCLHPAEIGTEDGTYMKCVWGLSCPRCERQQESSTTSTSFATSPYMDEAKGRVLADIATTTAVLRQRCNDILYFLSDEAEALFISLMEQMQVTSQGMWQSRGYVQELSPL